MKHSKKRALGVIAAVTAGDGVLKEVAERRLKDGKKKELFHGKIVLELLHNHGAALGALENHPNLLLSFNSGLLGVAAGTLLFGSPAKRSARVRCGLALLIGGGLSNLSDRMKKGYVTDYFTIHAGRPFERLKNVVFNLSDLCVFAGSLLWLSGIGEPED